ncbi:TerD family protein [Bacillus sp. T33-2]|uniref:TerD family protein n=1 Tax=Bacillus sp. T33-2 TaxID=2054168 RepID=UPI000C78C192|nr:TerD family protein [Bacillus sp. T33-2]PLR98735.1 tellurium resistance protein [Bacillus sp. T33-2]
MPVTLSKGQKTDLTKAYPGLQHITVGLGWDIMNNGASYDLDASAFLLGPEGKVIDERDFVFYNNPSGGNGSILYSGDNRTGIGVQDDEQIQIHLAAVPMHIHRIAFTVTIHDAESKGQHFGNLTNAYIRIINNETQEVLLYFDLGKGFSVETAIVAAELYRHNGEWKFNAVASGFHGGLAALCTNFGVKIEEQAPVQQLPPTPMPEPAPIQPVISLTKIELKKKETVSIRKSSKITASLMWDKSNKDLDLYCFYITKNGKQGKVYYKDLGSAQSIPFITLDGDSRTNGCETIIIHKPDEIRFLLFAAYSALSNGIGSFKSMRARAVVDNHSGHTVIAPLLEENKYAYWVAIAHVDLIDSQNMKISHVESYSKRHVENSPVLYPDGSFKMDVGPIEFKSSGFFGSLFGK